VGKVETVERLLSEASGLRQQGRVLEAIAAYQSVLALRPDMAECWYNLAYLQRHARRFEEALASYREALDRGISRAEEAHLNRAVIYSDHLARADAAEVELAAALEINPDYVPALLNLGNLHEDRGAREDARKAYEGALAVEPGNILALVRLAGVSEIDNSDAALILQLKQALSCKLSDAERADVGYALGHALDSLGAHDEAFDAYVQANRAAHIASGRPYYDRGGHERFVDRLIAAFSSRAESNAGSNVQGPIFICGMFRSGSTLVERILGTHERVTAGGELDLLPALVQSKLQPYPEAMAMADGTRLDRLRDAYMNAVRARHPEAALLTDKSPDNFLHVGLIKTLFPEAKIIHTRRNPLDNCLSVFFLHLDSSRPYAFDLRDSAHWYRQQERLMAHWTTLYPHDIFELDYDALVAAPRPVLKRLLEFCGLDWDESCLDFHQAGGTVKTASVWQVREPLHRRASGRWRNYERHLDALRAALKDGV
jgi:tetratricopeptide (TPR) repeat protein